MHTRSRRSARLLAALAVSLALIASLTSARAAAADPDTPPPVAPVPAGFHWGVASSGYQSEGSAPDSNWSRYDDKTAEPYRDSVDFRNRYREDIELAAGLGVNTYRIGIEWARIEPRPGVVDNSALAFYDDVVAEIRRHGMTPMITLDHWVYPGWIRDRGGWADARTLDAWLANAQRVVSRYAGLGVLWVTFNEPVFYLRNEVEHGGISSLAALSMQSRIIAAHKRIYAFIHQVQPRALVTSNQAYVPVVQSVLDATFVDAWRNHLDYVGVDYYYGVTSDNYTAIKGLTGEFYKVEPEPQGIYFALRHYARKFPDLPLYVVENGMPTDNGAARADGYTRADFIRDHVYWVQRAIADGMDVIGYNYWSLTDNYEWGSYRPRFGLYQVDVLSDPDLVRKETDGVPAYRAVVADGGVHSGYQLSKAPQGCNFDDLAGCLTSLLGG